MVGNFGGAVNMLASSSVILNLMFPFTQSELKLTSPLHCLFHNYASGVIMFLDLLNSATRVAGLDNHLNTMGR